MFWLLNKKKFFVKNNDVKNVVSLLKLSDDLLSFKIKYKARKIKFFSFVHFLDTKKMIKFYLKNMNMPSYFFNYQNFMRNFKQSLILKKIYFKKYVLNFAKLRVNNLYNYFLFPSFKKRFFENKQFFSKRYIYKRNKKINYNLAQLVMSLSKKNFRKNVFLRFRNKIKPYKFYPQKNYLNFRKIKSNYISKIKKKNLIKCNTAYNNLVLKKRLLYNDKLAYKFFLKKNFVAIAHSKEKKIFFKFNFGFLNSRNLSFYALKKKIYFKNKHVKKTRFFLRRISNKNNKIKFFEKIKLKNKKQFLSENSQTLNFFRFKLDYPMHPFIFSEKFNIGYTNKLKTFRFFGKSKFSRAKRLRRDNKRISDFKKFLYFDSLNRASNKYGRTFINKNAVVRNDIRNYNHYKKIVNRRKRGNIVRFLNKRVGAFRNKRKSNNINKNSNKLWLNV